MKTLIKWNKVKAIIVEKNLTQRAIAEQMGISAKKLNNILNGRQEFRLSHLQKLRKALGGTYLLEDLIPR
jgi:transcriptional regulator with XRE-family HTH domain